MRGGTKLDKLNITSIARGALIELAGIEIDKILENIADPNTDLKKARKLTITLTFKPTDRDSSNIEIQTKSSVVPYNPVATQIYIGKDNAGNVVAEEFLKGQMKGQLLIDTNSGEVLKEGTEETKVININR